MTNIKDIDFRGDIIELADMGEFFLVDFPAFSYIHSADSTAKPLCADKGGRHLGEATPGVAVAFPTRNHGMLHKHFGIGKDEDGNVFAYGKGSSLTSHKRAKAWLVGALIGDTIRVFDREYIIEETSNQNIKLVPAK